MKGASAPFNPIGRNALQSRARIDHPLPTQSGADWPPAKVYSSSISFFSSPSAAVAAWSPVSDSAPGGEGSSHPGPTSPPVSPTSQGSSRGRPWGFFSPRSSLSDSVSYASLVSSPPSSPQHSWASGAGMPRPYSGLMRPLVALALPGMYLVYKYNQYRRQQQEASRRKAAERELAHLNHKIEKLLNKLDEHEPELAMTQEEECVICVNAKATMQTFPCGHQVVCRKCFVKTIQVAVSQRLLPLRCVVCRAKVLKLRQSRDYFPSSVSQYSMTAVATSSRALPTSHSLYSFGSGSSSVSGVSNISSVSSNSNGSYGSFGKGSKSTNIRPSSAPATYRCQNSSASKAVTTANKGIRRKENKELVPQIRISDIQNTGIEVVPLAPRAIRVHIRENKVAPQDGNGRLPTIKEYSEFISDKHTEGGEKSSSTRIKCAHKLVSQVEHNSSQKSARAAGNRGSAVKRDSPLPARTPGRLNPRALSRSPSISPSPSTSSARSTPDKRTYTRRDSSASSASLKSSVSTKSSASTRSSTSGHSTVSYRSTVSTRSTISGKSYVSIRSDTSSQSASSSKSVIPLKEASTSESSKGITGVKSFISSFRKDSDSRNTRRKSSTNKCSEKSDKPNKEELKKSKRIFEGKEYQRL